MGIAHPIFAPSSRYREPATRAGESAPLLSFRKSAPSLPTILGGAIIAARRARGDCPMGNPSAWRMVINVRVWSVAELIMGFM
jgi:hypothetical protein